MNATVARALVSARWGLSRIFFILAGVAIWMSFFYWSTAGTTPGYGILHPEILLWTAGHWVIVLVLLIFGVVLSPYGGNNDQ